jgi:hypothetical protein
MILETKADRKNRKKDGQMNILKEDTDRLADRQMSGQIDRRMDR